jgi:hypothetical protein
LCPYHRQKKIEKEEEEKKRRREQLMVLTNTNTRVKIIYSNLDYWYTTEDSARTNPSFWKSIVAPCCV